MKRRLCYSMFNFSYFALIPSTKLMGISNLYYVIGNNSAQPGEEEEEKWTLEVYSKWGMRQRRHAGWRNETKSRRVEERAENEEEVGVPVDGQYKQDAPLLSVWVFVIRVKNQGSAKVKAVVRIILLFFLAKASETEYFLFPWKTVFSPRGFFLFSFVNDKTAITLLLP